MTVQILTLKLEDITAGDYLTWCRDPDPPALDDGLNSIHVDADPLGDTITAILSWDRSAPEPEAAAAAAGLPLTPGVQVHPPGVTSATHSHNDHRFITELGRQEGKPMALAIR